MKTNGIFYSIKKLGRWKHAKKINEWVYWYRNTKKIHFSRRIPTKNKIIVTAVKQEVIEISQRDVKNALIYVVLHATVYAKSLFLVLDLRIINDDKNFKK